MSHACKNCQATGVTLRHGDFSCRQPQLIECGCCGNLVCAACRAGEPEDQVEEALCDACWCQKYDQPAPLVLLAGRRAIN